MYSILIYDKSDEVKQESTGMDDNLAYRTHETKLVEMSNSVNVRLLEQTDNNINQFLGFTSLKHKECIMDETSLAEVGSRFNQCSVPC